MVVSSFTGVGKDMSGQEISVSAKNTLSQTTQMVNQEIEDPGQEIT